ncbi:lysophospholipid acyltransferase family protein [Staphylospora marina]|uniref:lysophospholipid acyltransferase family protein n=1 Tax=Staphylospora marina TaxID=2490858 RepID=UPI000F5C115F|nr:lysophospholipid acyltransferase family protein [Staphylospora marina]
MLYALARKLVRGFFRLFFRLRVEGVEHIPEEGSAIICCNHISNIDPPLVGCSIPRKVHFMAKEELFRIPLLKSLIRALGAFPVRRGAGDRQALKHSIQLLGEGKLLVIFPEGTRVKDGRESKVHSGAAYIALKANAPIVPAAIVGPIKMFRPLRVVFGPPVHPSLYADKKINTQTAAEMIEAVMAEIRRIRREHG